MVMLTARRCAAGLGLGVLIALAAGGSPAARADDDEVRAAVQMLGGGLEPPAPSMAADNGAYRIDAARHLYRNYPALVHRGQLPARLHTVAIVETTIGADGQVEKVEMVREPSAPAAVPFIVGMIQSAGPFPVAPRLGRVVYRDIWLIAQGRFQLDSVTEGQAHESAALRGPTTP